MSNRYILAEIAQQELEDILRYIAHRSDIETALRVDQEFHAEFLHLAGNPLIGHTRPDIPRTYRVWHLYSYLIIYKPDTNPLEIMRVWHGARRPPALR